MFPKIVGMQAKNGRPNTKIRETVKNPNGQAMGEGNGTVNQDLEIIGTEQLTVPAGTFQTIKVSVEATTWFAKNIGMVKSETKGMGMPGVAVTELL